MEKKRIAVVGRRRLNADNYCSVLCCVHGGRRKVETDMGWRLGPIEFGPRGPIRTFLRWEGVGNIFGGCNMTSWGWEFGIVESLPI